MGISGETTSQVGTAILNQEVEEERYYGEGEG